VDRPADVPFSGASARFAIVQPGGVFRAPFRLEATVTPTEVEPLAPLTFTVTIHCVARQLRPPQRIDLREVPAFTLAFHVEDVTDGQKEKIAPATWRWVYRLKPRSETTDEVPGLPFLFYNPDIRPPAKAFQTIYTDPIPITVRPTETNRGHIDVPDSALTFATGSAVLAEQPLWPGPGACLVGVVLLGPPVVCALWYLAWRRMYPDAARLVQQRRSRAARRALGRLDKAGRQSGRELAESVAQALAGYLRERFDLASAEPTPAEALALLVRQGWVAEQASQAAVLLAECAEARFQSQEQTESELVEKTRRFILEMEKE
jgi:hypothetical protein